jgi:glutaredoxin
MNVRHHFKSVFGLGLASFPSWFRPVGKRELWTAVGLLCSVLVSASPAFSQTAKIVEDVARANSARDVLIDLYFDGEDANHRAWLTDLNAATLEMKGVRLVERNVAKNPELRKSLSLIQKADQLPPESLPLIYVFNRTISSYKNRDGLVEQIEDALKIRMYTQPNCPHCVMATEFYSKILPNYPAQRLQKLDIQADPTAKLSMEQVLKGKNVQQSALPISVVAKQVFIGFDRVQDSGSVIQKWMERYSLPSKTNSR